MNNSINNKVNIISKQLEGLTAREAKSIILKVVEKYNEEHTISYEVDKESRAKEACIQKAYKHYKTNMTAVEQYNLKGDLIAHYNSLTAAAEAFSSYNCVGAKRGANSVSAKQNISACIHGRTYTAYGFVWKYADK